MVTGWHDLGIAGAATAFSHRPYQARHAGACYNRGNVLKAPGRYEEAMTSYDQAIRPGAGMRNHIGNVGERVPGLSGLHLPDHGHGQALVGADARSC